MFDHNYDDPGVKEKTNKQGNASGGILFTS